MHDFKEKDKRDLLMEKKNLNEKDKQGEEKLERLK